jgi:hypothetical protein
MTPERLIQADEHQTVLGVPCRHVLINLVRESKPLRVSHFAAVWELRSIASEQAEQPEQESLPALAARAADIARGSDPHRGEATRQILQSIVDGEEQTLQPPSIVTNPRGRPRGALGRRRQAEPASSTRRDPSLFEHAEAEAAGPSGRRCGQCGEHGHNRRTCPQRRPEAPDAQQAHNMQVGTVEGVPYTEQNTHAETA